MSAPRRLTILSLLVIAIAYATCETCQAPTVKSKVYSTTDATVVSDIAFVTEFTVVCKNPVKDLTLYADVNGEALLPAIRSTTDKTKYQVSWTEAPNKVRSGNHEVKIYDFDGFTELKKSQRSGDKESSAKPIFTVNVRHQGSYFGPWVQSEFLASAIAFLVWYFAYSSKSKIMS